MCMYIYFLGTDHFYIKSDLNKLKDVLGRGKLVLISIIGRRALKVIIKCFLSTKAGTTHSLLENNFFLIFIYF